MWLPCGCPVSHPVFSSVSHRWSHIVQNLLHSKWTHYTLCALPVVENWKCTLHCSAHAQCTMHSALAKGVADQLARGPTSNVPSSLDVLLITLITHCHGWCVNISTHHLMNHSSLSLLSLFDLNTEFSQFLQDQHFECTARLISSIYSLCLLCKIMFNMFKW